MFNPAKIRKLRENKNWSLSDLAFELAKMSHRYTRQTLCNWELGVTQPKANDIACLAEIFSVSVQYFFEEIITQIS